MPTLMIRRTCSSYGVITARLDIVRAVTPRRRLPVAISLIVRGIRPRPLREGHSPEKRFKVSNESKSACLPTKRMSGDWREGDSTRRRKCEAITSDNGVDRGGVGADTITRFATRIGKLDDEDDEGKVQDCEWIREAEEDDEGVCDGSE